jgi:magnesium-transporting ATPase (P-type)
MALIKWHSLSVDEALTKIKSSAEGLSEAEAAKRLARLGANELPQQKPYSKLRLFLNQFKSPLMYILFGTIAVSVALKHYSDTVMILVVMFANTLVGFYQENKANNSIAHLKKLVKIQARVLRDGKEKEIDSRELTQGDIIILHAGSKIPADARIIESRSFKTSEASLTGESFPVDKQSKKIKPESELGDRNNMVFLGTLDEDGFAKAVVVSLGTYTKLGEIFSLIS